MKKYFHGFKRLKKIQQNVQNPGQTLIQLGIGQ